MTEDTRTDPDRCVWCAQARILPTRLPGLEHHLWAETMATPDCDHETLDGRR